MKCAQFAFGQVCDFSILVDIFQIDEERAICVSRSDKETDYGMTRDLNVGFEWLTRVREKLLVFLSTIRINDFAANLSVPAILRAGSRVEIDRVAIFTGLWPFHSQGIVFVEVPRHHSGTRNRPRVRRFPPLFDSAV